MLEVTIIFEQIFDSFETSDHEFWNYMDNELSCMIVDLMPMHAVDL